MVRILEQELAYYEESKASWLRAHRGEFALIKGARLLGFFPSRHEAYLAGLSELGNVEMLIQAVTEREAFAMLPSVNVLEPNGL